AAQWAHTGAAPGSVNGCLADAICMIIHDHPARERTHLAPFYEELCQGGGSGRPFECAPALVGVNVVRPVGPLHVDTSGASSRYGACPRPGGVPGRRGRG